MKFKHDIEAQAGFKDKDGQLGTAGQILSSTGSQTDWIDQGDVAAGSADKALSLTIRVKNTESVALTKGQVVCAAPTATPPSGNVIEVKLADNDGTNSMPAIGVLNEGLDAAGGANDEGEAIMFGRISGINTSAFAVGDEVFVSDTPGALTATKPTGVKYIQKIGVVMRDDASNGTIEVFGAGRTNDVPTPLYIDHANQRVGIGVEIPSEKLDVSGNTKITGDLTILSSGVSGFGKIHYGVNGTMGQTTSWNPNNDNPGLWIESEGGESGGVFMNGNTFALWSPGDDDLLKIYDEDSLPSGTPLFKITGNGVAVGYKGFSSDDNAKSYTWRALDNTGSSTNEYYRIAKIIGAQSTRFIIELAGRSTSYSDGSIPAYGKIVGQLNNDNNYDIVYYNASGTDEVVDEIGQVDINTSTTDIYIRVGQFAELVATASISDGSIIPYNGDNGSITAPTGYTAATEYKIWNEANDGSGSGLDADLLDGHHASDFADASHNHDSTYLGITAKAADSNLLDGIDSSSFLRSDAADTATGTISFAAGVNIVANPLRFQRNSTSQTGQDDNVSVTVDDSNIYFTHNNDDDGDASGFNFRYSTAGTTANLLNFSSSSLTYKGNTIWHAGNDGSGSGLDADLLDGQHASAFQPAGSYLTGNQTITLSGDVSGSGTTSISVTVNDDSHNHTYIYSGGTGPATEDLNSVADAVTVGRLSYRGFNSSSTNKPPVSDNANGVITVGQHSGFYTAQLAFSSNGNIYWRDNPSTTYGTWRKMWDDGNDGSGSGLDADLLDGVHGGSFLRSDTADTFSGDLSNGTSGAAISLGYDVSSINDTIGTSNWFRSSGGSGWYNGTHGGGIHMTDSTWVRVYNNKKFYVNNGAFFAGDVGIGTTTPTKKLDVVGEATISDNLYIGSGNGLYPGTYPAQYSLIVGRNNAMGGMASGIIGDNNTIQSLSEPWNSFGGNLIAGRNNEINGGYSHANGIFGTDNSVAQSTQSEANNLVAGEFNTLHAKSAFMYGYSGFATGDQSLTGGWDSNNFGGFGSVAIGAGATASLGNNQYAFGTGVTTPTTVSSAYGADQFVVGKFNEYTNASSVPHRFAVGNGASDASRDTPFCVIGGGTYTNGQVSINDADGFAYTSAPYSIFHVNGRATSSYSSTFTVTSDERLKKDILDYNKGLAEILQVQPKSYSFNGKANTTEGVESIGVLAQEIKEVFPETVGTVNKRLNPEDEQETELYTVDISPVTYALINAVKELNAKVEALEARIQTLEGN